MPGSSSESVDFAFAGVRYSMVGFAVWGTLVGGIVLGVAQTVGAELDPQYGILAGHLVFLAVLVLRPTGLFPKGALA